MFSASQIRRRCPPPNFGWSADSALPLIASPGQKFLVPHGGLGKRHLNCFLETKPDLVGKYRCFPRHAETTGGEAPPSRRRGDDGGLNHSTAGEEHSPWHAEASMVSGKGQQQSLWALRSAVFARQPARIRMLPAARVLPRCRLPERGNLTAASCSTHETVSSLPASSDRPCSPASIRSSSASSLLPGGAGAFSCGVAPHRDTSSSPDTRASCTDFSSGDRTGKQCCRERGVSSLEVEPGLRRKEREGVPKIREHTVRSVASLMCRQAKRHADAGNAGLFLSAITAAVVRLLEQSSFDSSFPVLGCSC